jgi:hypothetical protein
MSPPKGLSKFSLRLQKAGKRRSVDDAASVPESDARDAPILSPVTEENDWSDFEEVSREEAVEAIEAPPKPIPNAAPVAGPSTSASAGPMSSVAIPNGDRFSRPSSHRTPSFTSSLKSVNRSRKLSRASRQSRRSSGQQSSTLTSDLKLILDFPLPPSQFY